VPEAEVEPALDGRHVADAAAQLRRDVHRLEDRLDGRRVHRSALEGAVEIDQVQPLEAGFGKADRLGRRVVVEHRGAVHLAAQQAHGLAVLQVDGGKQDHFGASPSGRAPLPCRSL